MSFIGRILFVLVSPDQHVSERALPVLFLLGVTIFYFEFIFFLFLLFVSSALLAVNLACRGFQVRQRQQSRLQRPHFL